MNIITIDDNSLSSEVNATLIKSLHPSIKVIQLGSCAEAIARRFERIDGIVSDIRMPGIEPVQVLEKLTAAFPGKPLLFMSAMDPKELDHYIIRNRGYRIIDKNERFREMLDMLRSGLKLERLEGEFCH